MSKEEEYENNKKTQKLALDLGFGHDKGKSEHGEFKFINAVTKKKESFIDDETIKEVDTYLFKGSKYQVGELAVNTSVSTRSFEYLNTYSQILIYHSIKKAGLDVDQPIHLSLGLSIFNWHEKEVFLKSIETINVDNQIIKPTISLMAQGQGVYNTLKGDINKVVVIVDIGYYTLDFLVFKNGVPNHDLSSASTMGVHTMVTELRTKIRKMFHFDANEQLAKIVFDQGYIENHGDRTDLTDVIDELKEDYAKLLLSELRANALDTLREASRVVFAGGGAYYLTDEKLPANVEFCELPYEFSNVRGYYGTI